MKFAFSVDELGDLPDDDMAAFCIFAKKAYARFGENHLEITNTEITGSQAAQRELRANRTGYLRSIAHGANFFGMQELSGFCTADPDEIDFDDFQTAVEAIITRQALSAARPQGLHVAQKLREQMLGYVAGMRDAVAKSALGEKEKNRLFDILDRLEAELHRRKVSKMAVAALVLHLLMLPPDVNAALPFYEGLIKRLGSALHQAEEEHKAFEALSMNLEPLLIEDHAAR